MSNHKKRYEVSDGYPVVVTRTDKRMIVYEFDASTERADRVLVIVDFDGGINWRVKAAMRDYSLFGRDVKAAHEKAFSLAVEYSRNAFANDELQRERARQRQTLTDEATGALDTLWAGLEDDSTPE